MKVRLTPLVTILVGAIACAGTMTIPQYERSASGFVHTSAIQGQLIQDGRCLMLRTRDGVSHLLAWPHPGTAWNPSELSVTVDGVEVHLGATIIIGGGEFESPLDRDGWFVPPPRECWRERRWLVEFFPDASKTEAVRAWPLPPLPLALPANSAQAE